MNNNNKDDNVLYQEIKSILEFHSLKTTIHKEFTEWLYLIKCARIVELAPTDTWTEDESTIQVMRLGKNNLPPNDTINEDDYDLFIDPKPHPYESYLHVIKLPMGIPEAVADPIPQFLFVRPDEYKLMTSLCRGPRNAILLGNPGISKSWFQWKYILFCCRIDLFELLWQQGEIFTEGNDGNNEESDDNNEPRAPKQAQLYKNNQEEPDDVDEKSPPKAGQSYKKDQEESDDDYNESPPKNIRTIQTYLMSTMNLKKVCHSHRDI